MHEVAIWVSRPDFAMATALLRAVVVALLLLPIVDAVDPREEARSTLGDLQKVAMGLSDLAGNAKVLVKQASITFAPRSFFNELIAMYNGLHMGLPDAVADADQHLDRLIAGLQSQLKKAIAVKQVFYDLNRRLCFEELLRQRLETLAIEDVPDDK
ncbi:unnamed protein product (mitochondrion) [Plasmodiophora brassicae]|uniref:Uncharacterized protein n=2 Tax=Plasmodiophora brassicae TaxID=37360 RepID=A0A3P3YGC1_PLABS|nr:unnamed protein product [Plasmodiophora brassicae]